MLVTRYALSLFSPVDPGWVRRGPSSDSHRPHFPSSGANSDGQPTWPTTGTPRWEIALKSSIIKCVSFVVSYGNCNFLEMSSSVDHLDVLELGSSASCWGAGSGPNTNSLEGQLDNFFVALLEMCSSSDDDFLDDMPELESSTNGSGSGTKTLADSLTAQLTSSGWLNIVFVALLEVSSSFDDDFFDDVPELGFSAGCSGSRHYLNKIDATYCKFLKG